MFKNKEIKDFAKRQIAMFLAIIMAFSCFASTGAITAYANQETTIIFEKFDADTNEKFAGTLYGVYSDAECTTKLGEVLISDGQTQLTITSGVYYLKEIAREHNPEDEYELVDGYEASEDVITVDATGGGEMTVSIPTKPLSLDINVKVVDAKDNATLSETEVIVREYNEESEDWEEDALVVLTYSEEDDAFVIATPYTNSKGVEYNDNMLHFSQSNHGNFIVEIVNPQTGYIKNENGIMFELKDFKDNAGEKVILNKASLSLEISVADEENNGIADADMKFVYDGMSYEGITDSEGKLLITDIPEGESMEGKLYQISIPEGYEVADNYKDGGEGQTITLSKSEIVNGHYASSAKVLNSKILPEITSGTIVIEGFQGASYTVYSDEELANIANDAHGLPIRDRIADENGHVILENMALGIYYVKESAPVEGYAAQNTPVSVQLLIDYAVEGKLEVAADMVGNSERQTVILNLKKLDEITDEPVEGAVYALYADSDLKTISGDVVKASDEPIGYYVTDEDGEIKVDKFGSAELVVGDVTHPVVDVVGENDTNINGEGLVNGKYHFEEISVPVGYILSENTFDIDASWNKDNTEAVLTMDAVIVKTVKDETHVLFSLVKTVGENKVAVEGAKLQLIDANDEIAHEWTTGADAEMIDGLDAGTYILHEVVTPKGHVTIEDAEIVIEKTIEEQEFEIESDILTVKFSKIDSTSGAHVAGAELVILDKDKNVLKDDEENEIKWTTNGTACVVSYLPVGTYYLRETNTPNGYQRAEDVRFIVVDSAETLNVEMKSDRTYGSLELYKKDAKTDEPIEGVVFNLISVNEVVDPVTEKTIYTKGQVVATLKTDNNGRAEMTDVVPIGTYNKDGFVETIKYQLVEVQAATGQYDAKDANCDVEFAYVDAATPVVKLSLTLKNNKPIITVTNVGSIKTYVGAYEDRENVTIVENGDEIEYTITVKNDGDASAWNVVVRNEIPKNTTFVKVLKAENDEFDDHNAKYDEETNCVYWSIDEVVVGDPVVLKFTVKVNSEDACEIKSMAQYAMPTTIPEEEDDFLVPNDDNNDWQNTDTVVYQTIGFDKNTNDDAAKVVSPGDTIHYSLTFKAINDVHDIVVTDVVPNGLTYVSGSAVINKQADKGAAFNPDTKTLTFSKVDADDEEVTFEFDVTVDDVAIGETVYYKNIAVAKYSISGDAETKEVEYVTTHYADKKLSVDRDASVKGDMNYVPILKKNDEVKYGLQIKNDGDSNIKNVVVTDVIPEGMTCVANETPDDVAVWIDNATGKLTWYVAELTPGESIDVAYVAKVKEQKAMRLASAASYGTVDETIDDIAPVLPTDSATTDPINYHVIEFHKISEVEGGTNHHNATAVSVGDTITYTLQVITKAKMGSCVISDAIPEGMTFVPGSIAIKESATGEWKQIGDDDFDKETNRIAMDFDSIEDMLYIKFSATVDHIPVNTEKFYFNQASIEYTTSPNAGENNPKHVILYSEEVTHMASVRLEGSSGNGELETQTGITVIKNGDKIVYEMTIDNIGASDINNLVIYNKIPENTKYDSVDKSGKYDAKDNSVSWIIDTLEAGKSVTVQFTVLANSEKAAEVVNQTAYAVPEDIDNIKDDEWMYTNKSTFQIVALHLDASIEHGNNKDNAKHVEAGKEFTYTISFDAANTVYGLSIEDVLPTGLKFVKGSAAYTLPGKDTVKLKDLDVNSKNVIIFPTIDEVPAGTSKFTFNVVVEKVETKEGEEEKKDERYFLNAATATVLRYEDAEDILELTSEIVANTTIKNEVVLGFESMNETVVWSLIAIVSAMAMVAFGIYGYADQKKKKR